jgi:hypothetical protein
MNEIIRYAVLCARLEYAMLLISSAVSRVVLEKSRCVLLFGFLMTDCPVS